jgi:GH25 family lysozyme M1 (1,4-beta-N-acetylmuramidase)
MWQYASDGKVGGIAGNVDMNISNVDYPTIIKQKGLNGFNSNLKGDVDGDGKIDSTDYLLTKKYILGNTNLTDEQKKRANINSDDSIDSIDLLLIKKEIQNNK